MRSQAIPTPAEGLGDRPVTEAMSMAKARVPAAARGPREGARHPLVLPESTPIGKAAAIMSSEQIELAVVVDYDRRVIGFLSALDLVRWLAHSDGYVI